MMEALAGLVLAARVEKMRSTLLSGTYTTPFFFSSPPRMLMIMTTEDVIPTPKSVKELEVTRIS
jgi:hypothetical protein